MSSLASSFLRDSAIYTIPAIISRGMAFFLVPLYTRVLSPDDFGSLDLLIVFATLINLTVALEVSQGVARYYAEEMDTDRRIDYASSAFWFTVFCYTVFLFFAFFFSSNLSVLVMGREGLEYYFQIGIVYIWLNGILHLIQNQFRWELRSKNYATVSLIVTFVTASMAVTLAYSMHWGLSGLLYGMAAGALVGCLYGMWHLKASFRFRFKWLRLKTMLFFSIPLVPSGIGVFLTQYIDRVMINYFLTLNEVGLYGIGFRLASIAGLVMIGFQAALTPLVYTHYREVDTPRQLAKIFRLFLVPSLLMFLLISLFAKNILTIMTTPAYYPAETVVAFLVPAVLLSRMYIFTPGIFIAKKTYLIFWINIFGAVLNILLNLLLIPNFGIIGAALASLICYCCIFFAYMWFSQKFYFIPYEYKILVIGTSLIVLLAYWIHLVEIAAKLQLILKFCSIGLALIIIFKVGLIQVSELRKAKDMINSKFFQKN